MGQISPDWGVCVHGRVFRVWALKWNLGIETFLLEARKYLQHNHSTDMCSGSKAGSYLRLMDSCITQLEAQGLSRTCNESKEKEALRLGFWISGFGFWGFDLGI